MKPAFIKNALVFIAIFAVVMLIFPLLGQYGLNIWAAITAVIFLFSIIVRKQLSFKPYFTSKYNLLTSKFRREREFDFPKDLLFDKLVEVLESAELKVVHTNKEKGEIFALSQMTFSSCGENIYITLSEKNDHTVMHFCSATFFQIYSWGKNERNYERLFNEFEESLII